MWNLYTPPCFFIAKSFILNNTGWSRGVSSHEQNEHMPVINQIWGRGYMPPINSAPIKYKILCFPLIKKAPSGGVGGRCQNKFLV